MRRIWFWLVLGMFSSMSVFAQKVTEEEIFVTSFDSVRIYGTLLVPSKIKTQVPMAIIISGSGPTNRNGNSGLMNNNSLKYLAEGLTEKGIASFRFDKRGIGQSLSESVQEKDLRFEHYVGDVKQLVQFFEKDERFSRVVVVGHSEGSLIGMMAAQASKVSQFVSVSGVGRTADEILAEQLEMQYSKYQTKIVLDSLKQGHLVTDLGKLKKLFRPSVQPYMISWFKYNPQDEIRKLPCPALLLQGDNDIQVKVKEAELLVAAKPDAEMVVVPKMNHVLKIIKGDFNDNLKSYYNSDIPISGKLLKSIVTFIKKGV